MHTKVAIIGSGAAGWTAAIYAARANLEPVLFTGMQVGGQLTITTDVENFPGFPDGIQGPELMNRMQKQAEKFGTKCFFEDVVDIDFSVRPFKITGDSQQCTADTIIVCTGAEAMWLGLESETKLRGHGVSACATCDGMFFKDKIVAVVGGGNTAVTEAIHLSHFAKKVYVIHRKDHLRAESILQERIQKNEKIEFIWNNEIEEILGNEKVNGVKLNNVITNERINLPLDGVFIAIGHRPNTSLVNGKLEIDSHGYIITKSGTTQTSVSGVFAAGDVQDKLYRQATTAVGTGCMAALEAQWFIENMK